MYGTIAPKVVTHRIHLLIRWIFQREYTMRQPLLNVYIKMSYKSVRWRIMRIGKGVEQSGKSMRGSIVSSKVDLGVSIHFCRHWRRGGRRYCITLFIVRQVGLWKV